MKLVMHSEPSLPHRMVVKEKENHAQKGRINIEGTVFEGWDFQIAPLSVIPPYNSL